MRAHESSELDKLLDRVRELLGASDDGVLLEANTAVNQALQLHPSSVEAWLLKCQVASAAGDDLAALAAVEMALRRAPHRAEALYWRGAILGDLGRFREALRSIEAALRVLGDADAWLLEDLMYEKVTVLDALGLHDAAVAACATALERCPGSALLRAAANTAERARVRGGLRVLRGGA
ncbi:MAG TPA: tetratricopeptide repeat protein [Kofleriaceae bacterium]|jgi:tetratricopeptide (TPR) repeat protein